MVRRVLMVAFHFPPMFGSSSIQRSVRFAQYLPRHGWEAHVLSAHARAYPTVAQTDAVPDLAVRRTGAIDAARHLAIGGRYPLWLAMPDRWANWWCTAVPAALSLVRRQHFDLIWSTYPIATAHLVAATVQRITRLPWVADMRDPMTDAGYPSHPWRFRIHRRIESTAAARCDSVVCTTPGAVLRYRQQYAQYPPERFACIENGFDEEDFRLAVRAPREDRTFLLLHSGVVYPSERDPTALFDALALLARNNHINAATFCLRLRASGHDDFLASLARAKGVAHLIDLAPPLPYPQALGEMLVADGLLVLQGSNCNAQIPAKLYEYLRANRPILAVTDLLGDTAQALHDCSHALIAPCDQPCAIAAAISRLMVMTPPHAAGYPWARHTRAARTAELAQLFDHIMETRS